MTGVCAAVICACVLISLCCYIYYRRRFIRLSSDICRYAERILHGETVQSQQNQETITSKVVMELEKLERITSFRLMESRREKQQLLEMISEITHQIKSGFLHRRYAPAPDAGLLLLP